MGVFMQYRVMRALVVAFGAWVLKPKVTISKILWTIAFVDVSCWAYFVIQALQVIDLMSLVWGILSKYIVVGQLDRQNFFCIDGASDDRALRREQGLSRLSDSWKKTVAKVTAGQWVVQCFNARSQNEAIGIREHFSSHDLHLE